MPRVAFDLAGEGYWERLWSDAGEVSLLDPYARGASNYVVRRFHDFFRRVLLREKQNGTALLEVGCARSAWLPYFAREFGFNVTGLDYSHRGCQMTRDLLRHAGVDGEVVCTDLFTPPLTLHNQFDIVVSRGVVEHFSDTPACLSALAAYLKPGGLLVTVIPNMTGLNGLIEKLINRTVSEMHVRLTPADLASAHIEAGVEIQHSTFFLSTNFGVLNLNGLDRSAWQTRVKAQLCKNLARFSQMVWVIEERSGAFPALKVFSPYVLSTGRKPRASLKPP